MGNVKIKRSVLKSFLKKTLFEQYGAEGSRSSGEDLEGFRTSGEEETTVPNEVPVEASDQMATQLTQERPPIEDEDFIPSSPVELGRASDAWGRLVPDGQVEYFYQKIKLIYDAALEKHNNPEGEEKNESFIRKNISNQVHRILEKLESEEEYDDYRGSSAYEDEGGDEPAPTEPMETGPDGVGLEDLASQFGYCGASGVRQDLERIFKRLGFTAENITDEQLDAVRTYAQGEFIEELVVQEYIDEEDASELRANPSEVSCLDSFRFFFVSGFVLPAYRKVLRDSRKRIEAEIDKLGVPRKTRQTILNQALGDTPQNMQKLAAKLSRDAKGEGMADAEADATLDRVISGFPALAKIGKLEGDLVSIAMDMWQGANKAKKSRIMSQALSSTAEFQDS